MKNKLITFRDEGQDFLQWLITPDGEIIDCKPFQFSVWRSSLVKNFIDLEPGGYVEIQTASLPEITHIKYPIELVELTDHKHI